MGSDTTQYKSQNGKYTFYGRLNAGFPSQIIVDLTERCNLACKHCPHSIFQRSSEYSGRSLDIDLHHKMVEEVRDYGEGITQYIRYTSNGEPFMHPHIFSLLSDSIQHSGVFITLTTNGTLLTEKNSDKVLDLGLHMIDISIDANTPETYAKIRINGNYTITKRNVLALIKKRDEKNYATRIVVSFVEQQENRAERDDFIKFWYDSGVDSVVIRRLHSSAGEIKNIADALKETDQISRRYPCLYPWERITLNPRGELAFCPQDWSHGSVICSYRDTSIHDIWQGEFYEHLRTAHQNNDFTDCEFCGNCPDWQQTRWPDEGRSYVDLIEEFKETSHKQ